jgi:DNA-binding winged helix-turn-helix (wHTH) protein
VRMTLSNLRRKLVAVGTDQPIVTLPGRGYMLRGES